MKGPKANLARPWEAPTTPPKKGTRVRFTCDGLGASRREDLSRVTGEVYGVGDEGIVAFRHPNKARLPEWFYVEVNSKGVTGEKRYVGVTGSMYEIITPTPAGR